MVARTVRFGRWIVVLGMLIGTLLFGSGDLHAGRQQVDLNRAAVVQSYFLTLDRGDVDGALAAFADNAVLIGTRPTGNCSAQSPCTDLAGIRMQLEGNLVQGHHCQIPTSLEVLGSTVIGRTVVSNDTIRARGIERLLQTFIAQVPQDKITNLYLVYDLTDPGTAADLAIAAGTQQPGEPIPTPDPPCPESGS